MRKSRHKAKRRRLNQLRVLAEKKPEYFAYPFNQLHQEIGNAETNSSDEERNEDDGNPGPKEQPIFAEGESL